MVQPGGEGPVQAQGDLGVLGGVGAGLFDGDLVEGQLAGALAGDVREVDGAVAQEFEGEAVHVVAAGGAVEDVGLQHGVLGDAPQRDAVVGQYTHVVF